MENKCNGWSNYETWLVNLWLSNDEGYYQMYSWNTEDMSQEDIDNHIETLTEQLKSDLYDAMYDKIGNNGLFVDIVTRFLERVNWREIAEAFKD